MKALEVPRPAGSLPEWQVAFPLWLATCWQWIELSADGRAHLIHSEGGANEHPALIVLDCRAVRSVPEESWPRLGNPLRSGGGLFVCGLHDRTLPARISGAAGFLRPGDWHTISPGQENSWLLRPNTPALQAWSYSHLESPPGLRTWLSQVMKYRLYDPRRIPCLPAWRVESL